MITPGTYIHYKGGRCEVIGVARHSETLEGHVVYNHVDGDTGLLGMWVRPATMFAENVVVEGKTVPRFRRVDE